MECVVVSVKKQQPLKQIALAMPMRMPHLERAISGVMRYAREHTRWTFLTSPELPALSVSQLKGWPGDGVIAMVNTPAEVKAAKALKLPVVNLSGALKETPFPRVRVDYPEAGRVAADHLLGRGFQRFAYYGLKDVWYAGETGRGFAERVGEFGGKCAVHEASSSIDPKAPWMHDADQLDAWLKGLETPLGILASHDPRAGMLVEACTRVGLRVPDDVAVIGVNNDTISCEFSHPPLSSVARNGEKVGYEAAALLDGLMNGEAAPEGDTVLGPGEVVERKSTEVLSIENAELEQAVRYIHENLGRSFGVEELLGEISMSRRWLEYAFTQTLRRSPHQYICEARVERAKKMLSEDRGLKLKAVATACGFTNAKRMNVVFERIAGMSPREFRGKK